ncbi:chalcone isomerase family protein [Vibrio sp. WXL103]|uniref:chalcone isomerase family protein n=1 Tax=Vibrio sp. WXL103 TaxID=3450710 RepID=UPI003EC4F2B3
MAQPTALQTGPEWRSWGRVGSAELTWLFFDVYRSELYTPKGQYRLSHDVSPHPLALAITYQRDISSENLLKATQDQWQKLGFSEREIEQWSDELEDIYPDIATGDRLVYVSNGQQGHFEYRAAGSTDWLPIGHLSDERASDAFLSIWLSPQTEYPKLRRQLIGLKRAG